MLFENLSIHAKDTSVSNKINIRANSNTLIYMRFPLGTIILITGNIKQVTEIKELIVLF